MASTHNTTVEIFFKNEQVWVDNPQHPTVISFCKQFPWVEDLDYLPGIVKDVNHPNYTVQLIANTTERPEDRVIVHYTQLHKKEE